MSDVHVVAVVATHGEDRVGLLMERALASIARQTRAVDLVVVVSDNDPLSEFLDESDVKRCFDANLQQSVRLIPNWRTRGNSGCGPWNTGILAALASFGEDCWVAILDDDDEWEDNHIEACLDASADQSCMWVVSGITRVSPSGRRQENLLLSQPAADSFLSSNPGVQVRPFVHVISAGLLSILRIFTADYLQLTLLTCPYRVATSSCEYQLFLVR